MRSEVIASSEWKKLGLVGLTMLTLAHFRRKQMRKRWLKDKQPQQPIIDHPAFTYFIENLACLGTAWLIEKYFPILDRTRPIRTFFLLVLRSIISVEPLVLFEKLMASQVYSHVPYFSAKKPPQDWRTILNDYLRCNFTIVLLSNLFQARLLSNMSKERFDQMFVNPTSLRLVPYLGKFLFCRIIVDIVFGIAHRIMHENNWIYEKVHKQHHEHPTPRTQTNFHFQAFDLFIEASLPLLVSFTLLQNILSRPLNQIEQTFLSIPLVYYESASHTGKEAPIVTWFPLLSPLVDMLTGCDQRLIEYHTRHHQLYSISPWFDKLFGTYRIELPDSYSKEGSLE